MRRTGNGSRHRFGELGEDHALIFGVLDDLGRLEHLLIAPLRVRRPDALGLEVVFAVPDRVHCSQRDVLVGAVISGDMIGEQLRETEIKVGSAVAAERGGDRVVLIAEHDQVLRTEISEVDEPGE